MPIVESGADAQAPSLRTFSTLQNEVARYVLAPDDDEALAVAAMGINSAIRKINTRAWYWALTYLDIALAANDADYAISANFKSARSMMRMDSSLNPRGLLSYFDPHTFDQMFPDSTGAGTPVAYTVYSALDTFSVTLNILPSSSFVSQFPSLRMRYFARCPLLVNGGDTGFWPSEAEEWAKWYARAEVAAQFDPDKYNVAKREEQEFWNLLIRDNTEQHFRDFD